MARPSTRKKPVKTRAAKATRVSKKTSARPKARTKKPVKRRGTPVKKAASKLGSSTGSKRASGKGKVQKESKGTTTGQRKRITQFGAPIPAPETPPRLLAESKSTTAALVLLEKGIKLIHQKELSKARHELESIAETHPGEQEIIARAQSYLQICEREEAAQKKPQVTSDQLYTLGVMEHNRGNYKDAISYFEQSLGKNPNSDHILYSLAASRAMNDDVAEAMKTLREAIQLNEDNRIYAKNDPDFAPLHSNKEFVDLVGLSPSPSLDSARA